jgi:hypothetical protein
MARLSAEFGSDKAVLPSLSVASTNFYSAGRGNINHLVPTRGTFYMSVLKDQIMSELTGNTIT